jgi:hypothetical protein
MATPSKQRETPDATGNAPSTSKAREATEKAPPIAGAEQAQEKADEELEKGYVGETYDPLPNEVYALPDPGYHDDKVAPEIGGRTIIDAFAAEHGLEPPPADQPGPTGKQTAATNERALEQQDKARQEAKETRQQQQREQPQPQPQQ